MASVRQAVLEFDAAVQVPWRPLLGSDDGRAAGSGRAARAGAPIGPAVVLRLAGTGPRVTGHLRPVPDRPAGPESRAAEPAAPARGAGRAPTRRDQAAAGGRPATSRVVARGVRGGCAAPEGAASPRLRLTRRGRRMVLALALGGAVALGSVVAPILGGGGQDGLRLAGERSVVVEPGDTVWSIAGEVAGPGQDVRTVVDAIEELNDLEGSVVVPGQVLELP
ncbi:LysM domain-containing protein [Geodermatophilus africanus]|uniref:LysM domain-containing protein n=1 Tax=Geodermatophilus africanus TaxID=1137993 RepID=A0A1H3CDF7_9ACTN|nr:LysM peptidoglycan-binding domain-containing protein [Geodermatophilus africanus]SDX52177.1 LysM domain-containing protein [Geodermatophilus africanus]